MTHTISRIVQAIAVLAVLAALGPAAAQEDAAAVDTATVSTAEKSPYGAYLVDSAGTSIYLFKADQQGSGKSNCYDACAKAWPPLLTDGEPKVEGKADQSLLGTLERKNGSMQVTYNGWPLYYFVKDDEPGDTQGQDIKGFGAEWYLVTPEGKPVHAEGHESEGGGY